MFDGVENAIAQTVFAIPAVKGIEFGAGFAASRMRGSQNNDPFRYDEDGNIEAQEFYDGVDWSDNPADIRLNTSYCDEDEQDEWNLFFNDFMHLLESNELTEKAETLKEVDDSYYFVEECIEIVLTEED